jgi:murein DD-endopeptidase MepM/ murein hydrolase activator NlpD
MKRIVQIFFYLFCPYSVFSQQDSNVVSKSLNEITIYPSLSNFDTLSVFRLNWSNENIFPYPVNNNLILDKIIIKIIDSSEKFTIPFDGRINSGFGKRGRIFHKGLDIKLNKGDSIKAILDGKVRYAKYNKGGFGNLIIIRHVNQIETYYAHLTEINVKPNQIVKSGDFIGTGGNTGARWTGTHLHFEMRYFDRPFDPMLVINFDSLKLKNNHVKISNDSFKSKNNSRLSSKKDLKNRDKIKHYTIKNGDTLYKIAKKYHTSVGRICKDNKIKKNSILNLGDIIIIK